MIFVDASAIVAILTVEPESPALVLALEASATRRTSALAVFEAVLAICRKRSMTVETASESVADFLTAAEIVVEPIEASHGRLALAAHERYGKGRGHPAGLNMGDCFAYAMASSLGAALLCKGDDFVHTDIAIAG